ncbi:hypothetical protein EYZ11_002551 [Aspergillus tanneri]|uniref:Uncharacterized protein n=1 Tax=Aspergillus tanneri TaxID=1220188 RepID=A0A4S3JU20_9EURO|nr:hypothetical protein EYZ11_002551 [Aspergillus tanneri]
MKTKSESSRTNYAPVDKSWENPPTGNDSAIVLNGYYSPKLAEATRVSMDRANLTLSAAIGGFFAVLVPDIENVKITPESMQRFKMKWF